MCNVHPVIARQLLQYTTAGRVPNIVGHLSTSKVLRIKSVCHYNMVIKLPIVIELTVSEWLFPVDTTEMCFWVVLQ